MDKILDTVFPYTIMVLLFWHFLHYFYTLTCAFVLIILQVTDRLKWKTFLRYHIMLFWYCLLALQDQPGALTVYHKKFKGFVDFLVYYILPHVTDG